MKLYYWHVNPSNFGDELNPWLWNRLIPEYLDPLNDQVLFVGIGTLLNHKLPAVPEKIVFGTGVGYGQLPFLDESYTIYFVRGPRSAKALQLGEHMYITDPGVLMALPENLPKQNRVKKYRVSFIPHHTSYLNGDWDLVCKECGIHCISPFEKVEVVIEQILSSRLIIADAMHGAILADSYRIPWKSAHPDYGHAHPFKWHDWAESMRLAYSPSFIRPVWRGDSHLEWNTQIKNKIKRALLGVGIWKKTWGLPNKRQSSPIQLEQAAQGLSKLAERGNWLLSEDKVFNNRLDRCFEKVNLLQKDLSERFL